MSWNNGKEVARFEAEQRRQAIFYREAGMTEGQIEEIYRYDRECFLSDRAFYSHTVPLLPEGEAEDRNALYEDNLDKLSYEDSYECIEGTDWMEAIENVDLYKCIKALTKREQELLRLIAIGGYTQREIALNYLHVTEAYVSKLMRQIRRKIGGGMKNGKG